MIVRSGSQRSQYAWSEQENRRGQRDSRPSGTPFPAFVVVVVSACNLSSDGRQVWNRLWEKGDDVDGAAKRA